MKNRKPKPRKGTAYPEVVTHGREQWQVHEDNRAPRVEFNSRDMYVPLDVNERERQVRQHEQGHLALGDESLLDAAKERGTVAHDLLNAAADVRVNQYCQSKCGRWTETIAPPELVEGYKRRIEQGQVSRREAGGLYVASLGTMDETWVAEITPKDLLSAVDRCKLDEITRPLLDFAPNESVVDIAEKLTDFFREHEQQENKPQESQQGRPDPFGAESLGNEGGTAPEAVPERLKETYKNLKRPGSWGEMKINRLPLTRRVPVKMRGRSTRAGDTGAVVKYPHRAITDQRIFKANGRAPGATVLIDISGSMSLSPRDVETLVLSYPAGVVAVYNGNKRTGIGDLWVVANHGRMVPSKNCPVPGRWNIIDGPALDWLGRQKGPRYWVSDAIVNGANGSVNPALFDDADNKCRRYKITRITPEQFQRYLKEAK